MLKSPVWSTYGSAKPLRACVSPVICVWRSHVNPLCKCSRLLLKSWTPPTPSQILESTSMPSTISECHAVPGNRECLDWKAYIVEVAVSVLNSWHLVQKLYLVVPRQTAIEWSPIRAEGMHSQGLESSWTFRVNRDIKVTGLLGSFSQSLFILIFMWMRVCLPAYLGTMCAQCHRGHRGFWNAWNRA